MRSEPQPVLGLVTIGQSPRDDILPQMLPFLPPGVTIWQEGALDGLTREQIAGLAPAAGDYVLHTRIQDGSAVTVGRRQIQPRVQTCLDRLAARGANPILLLCTGEFPGLSHSGLLIEPDCLLVGVVHSLRPGRLGVLVPLSSQTEAAAQKWHIAARELNLESASPYGAEAEIQRAAAALAAQKPDLVVMDCMGYTASHKKAVAAICRCPVILAASLIARLTAELLSW